MKDRWRSFPLHITGAVSCSGSCEPGTVSPDNNNKCEKCPPGQYQAGSGATSCENCSLGHYQPESGAISCIESEPGDALI